MPLKPIKPASTKDLQALHRLFAEEAGLIREINHPYALLMSALMFGVLLKLIIDNSESLFGVSYKLEMLDRSTQEMTKASKAAGKEAFMGSSFHEDVQGLGAAAQKRRAAEMATIAQNRVEKLKRLKEGLGLAGMPDKDFFQAMDTNSRGLTKEETGFFRQKWIEKIKRIYNHDDVFKIPNTSGMSFEALFDAAFITPQRLQIDLMIKATLKMMIEEAGEKAKPGIIKAMETTIIANMKNIQSLMLRQRFLPELLASLGLHWLVVKPSINHLFPRGVFCPRTHTVARPPNLSTLSGQQAANLAKQYRENIRKLSGAAHFSRQLSRYGVLLFLSLAFLLEDTEWSPYIWTMVFSMMSVAVSNVASDWHSARETAKKQKQIATLEVQASTDYSTLKIKFSFVTLKTPEDALLNLNFKELEFDGTKFSASKVCRAVKSALFQHNISIQLIYRDSLTLLAMDALALLVPSTKNTIIKTVEAGLRRLIDKKRTAHERATSTSSPGSDTEAMPDLTLMAQARFSRERFPTLFRAKRQKRGLTAATPTASTAPAKTPHFWQVGAATLYADDPRVSRIGGTRGGEHYTYSDIDESNCPTAGLAEKFNGLILGNPHFVSAKGTQGLKRSHETVSTPAGPLPASIKAKPKGAHGHARAHAFAVSAGDGSGAVLHTFTSQNIIFKH